MRRIFVVLMLLGAVMLLSEPAIAKDRLIMGVHPYKSAKELYTIFNPIAAYVSQKLGKPVELQIGKTYEDAVQKVGTGQFDFSYLGPTSYVEARASFKVTPLVQIVNAGKPSFYGVIVVKKGSGISSLKGLKGKNFAFGDRDSTLTHVLPLYMLMDTGIQLSALKKYSFVGSHDNVALNVLNGTFDAGGLMPDIAEKYIERGLEIIAKSPDLPEHVFAATSSLDKETIAKLQNILLTMPPELYKKIKGSLTGMQKFNDKDFDNLRKILKMVEKESKK